MKQRYWFKRRRFGYGFTPTTWQGWSLLAGYIGLMLLAAGTLSPYATVAAILLLTAAFLLISLRTSPKPRWRWGWKATDNPEEDF